MYVTVSLKQYSIITLITLLSVKKTAQAIICPIPKK